MKNDRRPEFEKDYVYLLPECPVWNAEEMKRNRSSVYDPHSYSDDILRGMYLGWCISKDAEIKRHEEYTATRLEFLDRNPVLTPFAVIRSHSETFEAPPGFKWAVNFVTNNQWPESATLVGGVKYTLHTSSGAEYVDVVLLQTDNATDWDVCEAKALFRKLSNAFHVKTHFTYDEGGHEHSLTRLTIEHEEFVRLQNV